MKHHNNFLNRNNENNEYKHKMSGGEVFSFTAGIEDFGNRLDRVIASRLDGCSRNLICDLIRKGSIRINEASKKPSYCVKPGDQIVGRIPPPEPVALEAEPIEIDILFEDRDIIIVNKKAGMVVHPAPGHMRGTLANALLYHCPDIEGTGGEARPGIVHRLDKDTSGVIVVAKNQNAHIKLSSLFESRTIYKEYLTVVYGEVPSESGKIELPIGRHPTDRTKMAVVEGSKGRPAETHWTVQERFEGVTVLSVVLKTGRTHQIRVHCASMRHPIVGDLVYGSSKALRPFQKKPDVFNLLNVAERQMLHAHRMEFVHPVSGEIMSFTAPLPEDMSHLLNGLRQAAE